MPRFLTGTNGLPTPPAAAKAGGAPRGERGKSCRLVAPLTVLSVGLMLSPARAQPQPEPVPDPPATEPAPAIEDTPQEAPRAAEPASTDPLPPTGTEEELDQIRPGVAIKREFDRIAKEANLRLGIANTFLFQQATGGPGRRSAASGDLDLLAKWTAIGAGTKDTGILAFAAEYRYQIGSQPPSELGGQIGTLLGTTNGFSERTMIVKECYWDQRLFEDHFRVAVGRIDPENLFGGHKLQSANNYFLYKAFSTNPTIAFPGPGLAAAAQIKPVSWFYLDGGITDANGKATVPNFEGFFDAGEFLSFAEMALTPTIDGLGTGRYRLAVWHLDSREEADKPSDQGVTLSFDQDLGDRLIAFLRYGHADGDVASATDSVQGGVGFKDVLGKENLLGVAAAWSAPKDESKRDEKAIEVFQRFQITETSQLTFDVETIFDPSNAPNDDVLGVFSVRLRISF